MRGPAKVVRMRNAPGVVQFPPDWAEPVDGYTSHLRSAGRAETTIRTRIEHLRWLSRDHAGISPWDLTTERITRWAGGHTWARETRRAVNATLRGFYTWALVAGHTTTNPTTDLPKVTPGQPRPHPTPDTAYRIALACADDRERLMLRLAAEVGLRRAEVAQIHSRDLVEDLCGWSLVVHGKGSKDRIVPLPPGIAVTLRALPHGWAFPGGDDGHLSPRWVGKLIAQLLPEPWTMHSLRHRFATRAYAVEHDLLVVQQLLGHASPVTTRVYVEVPRDALRRTVLAAA